LISYEEYTPFGETALSWTDNQLDVSPKEYRYSAQEKDSSTGLYYYGHRYYLPTLCRWTRPDPAGTVDGLNLYAMVGNEPVGKFDVMGLSDNEIDPPKKVVTKMGGLIKKRKTNKKGRYTKKNMGENKSFQGMTSAFKGNKIATSHGGTGVFATDTMDISKVKKDRNEDIDFLRHLSTVFLAYNPRRIEVQAVLLDNKTVIISANKILNLDKDKPFLEDPVLEEKFYTKFKQRIDRHHKKLLEEKKGKYKEVKIMTLSNPFNLHAESNIVEYLMSNDNEDHTLDNVLAIAGTKRPCATCYCVLHSKFTKAKRKAKFNKNFGPFWNTLSANRSLQYFEDVSMSDEFQKKNTSRSDKTKKREQIAFDTSSEEENLRK